MTTAGDWLDRLHSAWPGLALGYRYDVQLGKMLDEKRISGNHLRPYLRNVDVQWGHINVEGLPRMDFDEADRVRFSLRRGDLLVCEGGEIGRAALWTGSSADDVYYQKALHRLRPFDSASESARFMFYALEAAAEQDAYANGGKATIAHLPAEAFRRIRFPKPPFAEQQRIANFLDDKTARIDALIGEMEALLASSHELQDATRRKALTQGLNLDGDLVESGERFLGEIPSHWKVTAWKKLGRFTGGSGFPIEYQGRTAEELPFFKVKDLDAPDLLEPLIETDNTVSRETARKLRATVFPAGVLTFAKVGAALLLLRVRQLGTPGCLDNNMMAFIPNESVVNPLFAQLALGTLPLDWLVNPGTVPSVSASQAGEVKVALPPLDEQQSIAAHVRVKSREFARVHARMLEHIALLREYRSSLISAAVTGQLDLGEFRQAA